jgi:hypothetical protein
VAANVFPLFMHAPATTTSGAHPSGKASRSASAPSAMLRTRCASSTTKPTTSTSMASPSEEWWPVQQPITPPMLSRCRRSPPAAHSGTSPTNPLSARRLPNAPTSTSPGLILARRPDGSSNWL